MASYEGTVSQALALLNELLTRDPENIHAHYCRGIILEFLGLKADSFAV